MIEYACAFTTTTDTTILNCHIARSSGCRCGERYVIEYARAFTTTTDTIPSAGSQLPFQGSLRLNSWVLTLDSSILPGF